MSGRSRLRTSINYASQKFIPEVLQGVFCTSLTPSRYTYYSFEPSERPANLTWTMPLPTIPLPVKKRPWGGQRRAYLHGSDEQRAKVASDYETLLQFWSKKAPVLYKEFPETWRKQALIIHSDITPELFAAFEKKRVNRTTVKAEYVAHAHACLRHKVQIEKPDGTWVSLSQLRTFRRSGETILSGNGSKLS